MCLPRVSLQQRERQMIRISGRLITFVKITGNLQRNHLEKDFPGKRGSDVGSLI